MPSSILRMQCQVLMYADAGIHVELLDIDRPYLNESTSESSSRPSLRYRAK